MTQLGPPKDISASDLFRKLLEAPRPSEVIDFPRKDDQGKPIDKIRIAVLTHEEHDKARESAFKHFRDKSYSPEDMKNMSMREVLSDRIAKELLVLACFTAKEQLKGENDTPIYGKIFHSAEDIGQLRSQEVEVLFNAYMLVQDKFGPREHDTDVDQWVARLTEGGQHYPLLSLDLPELANLTSSLAARISIMSLALDSLWSELPDTCQSALERFCSGTASSTEPQSESGEITTMEKARFDIDTIDAVELAKKTRAQAKLRDALDLEEED